MQKIYAYVDETGQDKKGKLFLVSVVLTGSERKGLREKLKKIEKASGKGNKKWSRSTRRQREKYIESIISGKDFIDRLFYSEYHDTKAYVDLTILTTAKAILNKAKIPYQSTVLVDGLKRSERRRFAAGLRKLNVRVSKVRGVRDQSDALIRVADAVAGFVRKSLGEDKSMRELFKKAMLRKVIQKI